MTDHLRWLWASTTMKDALPRQNIQTELVLSDPEQPDLLERYHLEIDEGEPDNYPVHIQYIASGSGDHMDEIRVLL